MKNICFILLFIISALSYGQVAPPQLRCVSVIGSSGDVQLTWIPPTVPTNTNSAFDSYEIFFSAVPGGPFTLLGAVSTHSTTSLVHTTTVSLIQSCYYYMVTKFGPGGSNTSKSSDTLRTIFLNINAVPQSLKLSWNPIRSPKLASTATTYTLIKEYPLGSWNDSVFTGGVVRYDTLNVCLAKINYQVLISDKSGCVSRSNIQGGEYSNLKTPDMPFVDSVSVLADGQTAIGWRIPRDKDITYYEIQYKNGNINDSLDALSGRDHSSYTYTSTAANSGTVGLYVKAIDSCGAGSVVDYVPRTMYLEPTYDICGYSTTLKWNAYQKLPGGILEYRIYYSEDGVNFDRVGATTDTVFTHEKTTPGINVCYFVRVVNKGETITASSNRACFVGRLVESASFVYISSASVVDNSTIELRMLIDNVPVSKGFTIERSEDGVNFDRIGYVAFDGKASYVFTDNNYVQADAKTYAYRVTVMDSCNNPRRISNISRTILLTVSENGSDVFSKKLSWSNHTGFAGPLSGYEVYRMVGDEGPLAPIAKTASATTFYIDDIQQAAERGARISYLVRAVEGAGNPYLLADHSNSNIVPVFVEGQIFVPNAFAPYGRNTTWRPVTHFVDKSEYHVYVYDRWGRVVFETTDDREEWDGVSYTPGTYTYLINYKNARGEYQQVKGFVTLVK